MNKFEQNDKNLEKVTGGADMVGLVTPLGEYPAEELIAMYIENPAAAKTYLTMAKAFMPNLIEEFKKECEEKNLIIPEGMLG